MAGMDPQLAWGFYTREVARLSLTTLVARGGTQPFSPHFNVLRTRHASGHGRVSL